MSGIAMRMSKDVRCLSDDGPSTLMVPAGKIVHLDVRLAPKQIGMVRAQYCGRTVHISVRQLREFGTEVAE